MAKPGSPVFKCSRRHEVFELYTATVLWLIFSRLPSCSQCCFRRSMRIEDVYMLDGEMKWKILTPMPKPNSHIESSWVVLNNSIIIVGVTTEKHPVTKRMILVGEVFQFHLDTLIIFLFIARFGWYIEHPYLAGARIQPPVNFTAMVCYWKASISHKNYTGWLLEWVALFYIWTERQRTR